MARGDALLFTLLTRWRKVLEITKNLVLEQGERYGGNAFSGKPCVVAVNSSNSSVQSTPRTALAVEKHVSRKAHPHTLPTTVMRFRGAQRPSRAPKAGGRDPNVSASSDHLVWAATLDRRGATARAHATDQKANHRG